MDVQEAQVQTNAGAETAFVLLQGTNLGNKISSVVLQTCVCKAVRYPGVYGFVLISNCRQACCALSPI